MDVSMTLAACLCTPYSVSYSMFSKRHTEERKDDAQDAGARPNPLGRDKVLGNG